MINRSFGALSVVVSIMFALGFMAGVTAVNAQGTEATPEDAGQPPALHAYPAHVHEGQCPEPGEVIFPLNDVSTLDVGVAPLGGTPVTDIATPALAADATPVAADAPGVNPVVAQSTTELEVSLDELLGAQHAINVHATPENLEIYIACGDIAGTPADGSLHIELQEVQNSGYIGEAHLFENGDGTTTVTIMLMLSALGLPGATPEATPAG
jgi:hypothetical protein